MEKDRQGSKGYAFHNCGGNYYDYSRSDSNGLGHFRQLLDAEPSARQNNRGKMTAFLAKNQFQNLKYFMGINCKRFSFFKRENAI